MPFAKIVSDLCDLQNEDIEPLFADVLRKKLLDNRHKEDAARRMAYGYFGWHDGSNNQLRLEFVDCVIRKFRNGDCFQGTP